MATGEQRRGGTREPERQTLTAVGLTDSHSVESILWPGFMEGTEGSPVLRYRQEVDMGRLLETVANASPGDRPDMVIVTNPMTFEQAGLLDATEGVADTRVPAAWTDPAGRWAPLYVQPVVLVYNSLYRLPPAHWPDLLEPVWRSRLVFEEPGRMLTSGPALAELRSTMGQAEWTAFIAGLAAQEPLTVPDNERSVLEVATGARWAGLANWNVARRVRAGSPVRHVFLDPTPCIPGFGALLKGTGGSELARRFLRWLVSDDGQRAYARTGRIPALPDADPALTTAAVVPTGIGRLIGTVDWLHDPGPWIDAYRAVFPDTRSWAGKLH